PDFGDSGLAPAVVQDVRTGRVRMLAYMNREALDRTRETGRVTFWSRSREELWEKGETSGNWLEARSIELDCDGDALLVRAVPHGPTCHTGRESCFDTRELWRADGDGDVDAAAGAGGERLSAILAELLEVVEERDRRRPEGSYTVELLEGGPEAAGRKVAEEGLEVALAAASEPGRADEESADLLYHLLVLWRTLGLDAGDVARVLQGRRPGSDD
nr:bifunctional phosphoribosyl-AMP cyclohydrolase/phosphoribosyl-ATP diphosphatase HisIE [Candidatus Palauibacterales bacterium]